MNDPYKAYADKKAKSERKHVKKNKKRPVLRLLTTLSGLVLISYCIGAFISDQASLDEQKKELEALRQKEAELIEKNEEYQAILSGEDEKEYMEHIAIEILGYSYPNERRFYDKTRNS